MSDDLSDMSLTEINERQAALEKEIARREREDPRDPYVKNTKTAAANTEVLANTYEQGVEDEEIAMILAPDLDLGVAREAGDLLGIGKTADLREPGGWGRR